MGIDWTLIITVIIGVIPATIASVAALIVSTQTHKTVTEAYARGKEEQRLINEIKDSVDER